MKSLNKSASIPANMKTLLATTLALLLPAAAWSQTLASVPGASSPARTELSDAGDAPANPGPRASLSPALDRAAIQAAMNKVAAWELKDRQPFFNRGWTFAALYDGLLAASADTGNAQGHDAVLKAAEGWDWQLDESRFPHADDQALGRAYLELYRERPKPERIAAVQRVMNQLIEHPDDPQKPVWWWCDALFMAPPVLARLTSITGDEKYTRYMDREWAITTALLYDPANHLYSRDNRYLDRNKMHEANGQPVFWSRGNGWVVAGLVSVLEYLPKDDPSRPLYQKQFVDMLTRIAALQPADGLWRAGLLDADAYKMPEVSGSAFFTYAMAYGVRNGLLDRRVFLPVLSRSWAAMVGQVYASGRLGSIQPIGFAPDAFLPSSSYVYGVGGFLLAGAELDRMLGAEPHAR